MGVDRTDYLMFGVDLGAYAFDWDKHEAEADGAPDARFDIVHDSMSGKYCIAGKIIASSDPYEGFEMAKIEPNELGIDRGRLASVVGDAFGLRLSADDFSLLLFTHYS